MKIVCINPPKFLKRLLRLLKRNKKTAAQAAVFAFRVCRPEKRIQKSEQLYVALFRLPKSEDFGGLQHDKKLGSVNFAAAQASGANVFAGNFAVWFNDGNFLHVYAPAATCFAMAVANLVTADLASLTNAAYSGHKKKSSFVCYNADILPLYFENCKQNNAYFQDY